jgi:hypothetical protein
MRKLAAEVLGTFALVFVGTGAIVINDVSGGVVSNVGIGLTFGLVVLAIAIQPALASALDAAARSTHAPTAGANGIVVLIRPGLSRRGAEVFSRTASAVKSFAWPTSRPTKHFPFIAGAPTLTDPSRAILGAGLPRPLPGKETETCLGLWNSRGSERPR